MVVFLGYDPRKQFVYDTLIRYFQDPVLYKIESRTPEDGTDVFAVRMESYLLKERRFLIVMVDTDPSIPYGHPRRLSELAWKVLQTRNITEEDEQLDRLPSVHYDIYRDAFEGYGLHVDHCTDDVTSYEVRPSLPLKVHLLHRKKGKFEYSDQGTILAAIETYQTLLCIIPDPDLSHDFL